MAKLLAIGLAVACVCSTLASAQDKSTDQPAKYVWYTVEKVNSGKFPVYMKVVSQFRDAANTAAPDFNWIAGTPITGESDRITYVTFHDNLASIEKMMKSLDKVGEVLMKNAALSSQQAESSAGANAVLAEYNKELSYRPDMVPISHTTWWSATLLGLRPGCDDDLKDLAKQVIDMHKKAGDNDHWMTYEIRGGVPQPAVLFVTTMKSLADDDQEPSAASKEIFGNPLAKQAFRKFDHECVTSVESTYSRVEPSLSRPPQSLVAANPDFWNGERGSPGGRHQREIQENHCRTGCPERDREEVATCCGGAPQGAPPYLSTDHHLLQISAAKRLSLEVSEFLHDLETL
jgi:hypothetical protein